MNQQLSKFKRLVVANIFLCVSTLLLPSAPVFACTTASTPNLKKTGPIIVKSFDWDNPDGLVFINQPHMQKRAVGVENSAFWQSKYSSVTFNQWGLNMPMGGMNEKGLVVEVEKVGTIKDYPEAKTQSGKKALNQLQWVQYILDNSHSLKSAVENAKKVYVVPSFSVTIPGTKAIKVFDIDAVHYQVCNKKGECKSFEYRGKELIISSLHAWKGVPKKTLAQGEIPYGPDTVGLDRATVEGPLVPVVANKYYEDDSTCLAEYMNLPDGEKCPDVEACNKACGDISSKNTWSSGRRFIKAAANAQAPKGITSVKKAFHYGFNEILDSVCNADTQWQIVYLPREQKVKWRTIDGNKNPEKCKPRHKGFGYVNLAKEKRPNCIGGIKVLDLDGSVSKKPYQEIPYGLLDKEFKTLQKIDEKALYLNFKHSRFKTNKGLEKIEAQGLATEQINSEVCLGPL